MYKVHEILLKVYKIFVILLAIEFSAEVLPSLKADLQNKCTRKRKVILTVILGKMVAVFYGSFIDLFPCGDY